MSKKKHRETTHPRMGLILLLFQLSWYYIYIMIMINYYSHIYLNSWAILGWFPLLTMIPLRENSEVVIICPYIYICISPVITCFTCCAFLASSRAGAKVSCSSSGRWAWAIPQMCSSKNGARIIYAKWLLLIITECINFLSTNCYWLAVLTILNNISQWEGLSHLLLKIKHVPNHRPE